MTEKENLERCRCVDALIRDIRERISKTERDIEELSSRTVVDTVRGGDGGTQLFKVEGLPQSVIEKREYCSKQGLISWAGHYQKRKRR